APGAEIARQRARPGIEPFDRTGLEHARERAGIERQECRFGEISRSPRLAAVAERGEPALEHLVAARVRDGLGMEEIEALLHRDGREELALPHGEGKQG